MLVSKIRVLPARLARAAGGRGANTAAYTRTTGMRYEPVRLYCLYVTRDSTDHGTKYMYVLAVPSRRTRRRLGYMNPFLES